MQNRVRIEIHGNDMLREQIDFAVQLGGAHQRGGRRDTHQKDMKENPPQN